MTDLAIGLTSQEVTKRQQAGKTNKVDARSSRSVIDILKANIFTLFNAILGLALVAVLLTGSWPDAVFGFVLISNAATGVIAELKAKRTLDSLAMLDVPVAHAQRDGKIVDIPIEQVVLDDVLVLKIGDQIPADGVVAQTNGLEVDESILTGESVPVKKHAGDELLSGSSIVSGSAYMQVQKVGADCYIQKISGQVKKFNLARSEIRDGINVVLKAISWVVIPVAILLAWAQVRAAGGLDALFNTPFGWQKAVLAAVAGIVGMVPQGLVLLTSVNFTVAAVVLARKKVLVQELPAVEVLARVDTICLDKTGTLTSGLLELEDVELRGEFLAKFAVESASLSANSSENIADKSVIQGKSLQSAAGLEVASVLITLSLGDDANATADAIRTGLNLKAAAGLIGTEKDTQIIPTNEKELIAKVPFSSARKWSGVSLAGKNSWILGAPEILFAGTPYLQEVSARIAELADTGARVLALGHSSCLLDADSPQVPADIYPAALVILREEVRPDAAQTLAWFGQQGVDVKIISGDNPLTVGAIAARLGLDVLGRIVDARTLPDPEQEPEKFKELVLQGRVFGRVTPEQKRAMVHSLQANGQTVAMTGDGVNDSLALKDADLGIAMGSGSRASKAAAKLVLLDGKFSHLPLVMAEGRRVIANMERVSALFLNKTTYAFVLAILVSLLGWTYVFLPRQLTLLGIFTIGLPGFFLAMPPNSSKYRPGFLKRTLLLALPAGIIGAISVLICLFMGQGYKAVDSTQATLVLAITSVALLSLLSRPIFGWRGLLLLAMITGICLVVLVPTLRAFFEIAVLTSYQWLQVALLGSIGAVLVLLCGYLARKITSHS